MKHKLMRFISCFLVLLIFAVPLIPPKTVEASESVVTDAMFSAMLMLIGGSALALSIPQITDNFTIPTTDFATLKSNFETTLANDAVKQQKWIELQTSYLAGGAVMAVTSTQLAQAGINDIYADFLEYCQSVYSYTLVGTAVTGKGTYIKSVKGYDVYISGDINNIHFGSWTYSSPYWVSNDYYFPDYYSNWINVGQLTIIKDGITASSYTIGRKYQKCYLQGSSASLEFEKVVLSSLGSFSFPAADINKGNITYTDGTILKATPTGTEFLPYLPWVIPGLALGTITEPSIQEQTIDFGGVAIPWGGAVPIDVPLALPIDDPIVIDPPLEPPISSPWGKIAAGLAGLLPGFLGRFDELTKAAQDLFIPGIDEIIDGLSDGLAGIEPWIDGITDGITGSLDGIRTGIEDITGGITGGITGTIDNINTAINDFTAPADKTLDTSKLKNVSTMIFNKFPFSIPFDFYHLVTMLNADPVAPYWGLSFDLTAFGAGVIPLPIDFSPFDDYAYIIRSFNMLAFVFFMLFVTKSLIWK